MSTTHKSRIPAKWSDPYQNLLCVLDHCREVQVLMDQKRILKTRKDKNSAEILAITHTTESELVDLYLLLEARFEYLDALVDKRIERFQEKDKESLVI